MFVNVVHVKVCVKSLISSTCFDKAWHLFRPTSISIYYTASTECPTCYQTRHFFNNFPTNEDIATKFESDLPHCVRNVKEKNVLLFKFHCNILIGVGIIIEMPGSVASGTPCTSVTITTQLIVRFEVLTAMTMKNTYFLDVTSCSLVKIYPNL
jgi:hypothetical protein